IALILSLVVFLFMNERWLETTDDELYELTMMVATSEANLQDEVLQRIRSFIGERLTIIPDDVGEVTE
ncbi:hypothetical protein MYX84_12990, partial [Acidobacteria bacterium AH-259-O06]|nr:hypothetical protein [Acidobacteria bacterium AH-259-O06]